MRLVVHQHGRDEEAAVERTAAGWRVSVGDRVHEVEAQETAEGLVSLIIDGVQREVRVDPLPSPPGGGRYRITTGGSAVPVDVDVLDPLTHVARRAHDKVRGGAHQRVTAYMPGRVVAVLAAEGEAVEAGQGVVVLEAMKMENEIRAEHAGTVGRLFVQPGQAVEGGDPLFELT
jgi:biotin carboxyl carrier protein